MRKSKDILIETQFMPPIAFFSLLIDTNALVLEAFENYQKGSFRNRCHILGANGLMRLSVPLKGGRNHASSVKEITISYEENWNMVHLQSIRSAYGSSPYFDHYYEGIHNILKIRFKTLFDLNKELIIYFLSVVGIQIQIRETELYQIVSDEFIDLRNILSPKTNLIAYKGVKFHPYLQVFAEKFDFHPNLSILDALFNLGPETRKYLIGIQKEIEH